MGGGASKASRIKKILNDIEESVCIGDFEMASAICLKAEPLFLKHSGNLVESLHNSLDEIRNLSTSLKILLAAQMQTATEANDLIRKGCLMECRDLLLVKLDHFEKDFDSNFGSRGASWLKNMNGQTEVSEAGWSEHHSSLSVDGSLVVCLAGGDVGSAVLDQALCICHFANHRRQN